MRLKRNNKRLYSHLESSKERQNNYERITPKYKQRT
jgi:hypothetical protein